MKPNQAPQTSQAAAPHHSRRAEAAIIHGRMAIREDTKTGYEFVTQDDPPDTDGNDKEDKAPAKPTKLAAKPIKDPKALTQETDPVLGTLVGGRYRIARLLGKGNMSRVYVAEQTSMQRNVAVKLLQPELVVDETAEGRFRQEVDAVSRLHSPHTIRFYDAGQTPDGVPYIVMELLAGQTLRERLDDAIVLPPFEVVSIANQIACSLHEAHEAGVLHRDLKPENVHFCHVPTPLQPFLKLLDFGLAKLLDERGPDDPTLTGKRQTVGTPAYMAPEMIVEERPVDHRSDIYALGLMCFEMLTGSRPFQEENSMKMALAHVRSPIPSAKERNPNLPDGIDEFFAAAMAKNPEYRPQHALDLAQLLSNCFCQPLAGSP